MRKRILYPILLLKSSLLVSGCAPGRVDHYDEFDPYGGRAPTADTVTTEFDALILLSRLSEERRVQVRLDDGREIVGTVAECEGRDFWLVDQPESETAVSHRFGIEEVGRIRVQRPGGSSGGETGAKFGAVTGGAFGLAVGITVFNNGFMYGSGKGELSSIIVPTAVFALLGTAVLGTVGLAVDGMGAVLGADPVGWETVYERSGFGDTRKQGADYGYNGAGAHH